MAESWEGCSIRWDHACQGCTEEALPGSGKRQTLSISHCWCLHKGCFQSRSNPSPGSQTCVFLSLRTHCCAHTHLWARNPAPCSAAAQAVVNRHLEGHSHQSQSKCSPDVGKCSSILRIINAWNGLLGRVTSAKVQGSFTEPLTCSCCPTGNDVQKGWAQSTLCLLPMYLMSNLSLKQRRFTFSAVRQILFLQLISSQQEGKMNSCQSSSLLLMQESN